MNTVVLLPLQKSWAQCSVGKREQWRWYMTVLVINHGIIKSICILNVVMHPMKKFDVDKPADFYRQEVKWTLAIR
jgi:hypothetical protein